MLPFESGYVKVLISSRALDSNVSVVVLVGMAFVYDECCSFIWFKIIAERVILEWIASLFMIFGIPPILR